MKILTPLLLFLVLLGSCSTHRFVFFSGSDPLDDNKEFVYEDEEIDIRYRFAGDNAPVNIYIYNKTDSVMFVDWARSVMVINERSIPYWNHTYYDEPIQYIAPHSYRESTRTDLLVFIEMFPNQKKNKEKMRNAVGEVNVKTFRFTEKNSPLAFRSKLLISKSENFQTENTYESDFWVSKIVQSPDRDLLLFDANDTYKNYKTMESKPGNMAVVSKMTKFGGAALNVAAYSLLLGLELYLESE